MSFASWLRGRQVRFARESRPLFSTSTRTARRVRLVVEQLEDRWLPSYGLSAVATFGGSNGSAPNGPVIEDSNGNLFGTTTQGGANGDGTIFELAAGSSSITTLASFNGTNGSDPIAGLVEDSSGNLFGTTSQGGANSDGTIFELAAGSSSITTLVSFNGTNGSGPTAGLVEDSSGNLFGTTPAGGAKGFGTVFEWVKSSGTLSVLASFNGTNGSNPQAGLVEDSNGNLFGTTTQGGANGDGTIFELVAGSSSITTLASFNGTNGSGPIGHLVEDDNGNFFGATEAGGASSAGTVFELGAGSTNITTLASFNGTNGSGSQGGVVEDGNGNLFGTTPTGGAWGDGVVFEWIKSSGTLSDIATFGGNSTNGYSPISSLIEDGKGNLFGTAAKGGFNTDFGTVFVVTPVPPQTIGVFDPATATWYLNGSNTAGPPTAGQFTYGGVNWYAVAGDFSGDGQTTAAVVDLSTETWYIRDSFNTFPPTTYSFRYGAPGWIPVVGDWNGSGQDGIGVVDPTTGTWYLRKEVGGGLADAGVFAYGAPGWIPVVGNWAGNADGRDGIGMVDPSTETWYLRNTPDAGGVSYIPFQYGAPGWTPLAGNWTDSNQTGIGVYDGTGTFYLRNELSSGNPDAGQFAYGAGGWTPLAGQWQNLTASGQLQLAAGIGPGAPSISNAVLQSTVQEALTLVRTDGANPLLLQELASANYTLAVLPPGVLGETFVQCNTVEISPDAAGFGWYVDTSADDPAFDAQGAAPAGSPAAGHEDLLTTVLHEMGHLAGQADVANATTGSNLMDTVLPLGTRRIDALDLVFANATFV